MELYEFVNPSDMITFYAPDNDIAEAVGLLVGRGKAGIAYTDEKRNKDLIPNTMTMFSGYDNGQEARILKTLKNRLDEIVAAGKTFAVCGPEFREEYDELTENSTNAAQIAKWDDKHRSSMSDWCSYARGMKLKPEKTAAPNQP